MVNNLNIAFSELPKISYVEFTVRISTELFEDMLGVNCLDAKEECGCLIIEDALELYKRRKK